MREKFCGIVPDTSGVPYRQFPRCYRSRTMIVVLCSLNCQKQTDVIPGVVKNIDHTRRVLQNSRL